MKKLIFTLLALCLAVAACEKKPTDIYPKEISFTEYSLESTSCQWKNFNRDDSIIVINSDEELKNYIECTDSTYPEIDFSKNSLLLVSKVADCNINSHIENLGLQQVANKYLLSADITPGVTDNAAPLVISVLVPKMAKADIVYLNFNINNNLTETWIWEVREVTITLTFCPTGENEGTFYSSIINDNRYIKFHDDIWLYYKIENDMIRVRTDRDFPPEINLQSAWITHQYTEDVLELEYAGYGPAIYITRYLFKKLQN